MPTGKTKEQQPKGRRKLRTSVKTNDHGSESKKDIIHETFVKPMATTEQQTTTKGGNGQDEEDAVPCSQKIVPTFRKAKRTKPAERKTGQDKSGNPKKRLKTTGQCRNRSSDVVTTIQDQSLASDNSNKDNSVSTWQSNRQQSDHSRTAQTCTPTIAQNVAAETITCNMETVTANDQEVQDEPISDSPTALQVTEQKLEDNQIEHLTNKCSSQEHANQVKGYSLYGVGDQQLIGDSDLSTEEINNKSGKQSECDKEPHNVDKEPHNVCHEIVDKTECDKEPHIVCHVIVNKTVIDGITQEQESFENIPNKKPGAWKKAEPDVQLIDMLKCKGVPSELFIGDGHSKLMNKDEEIDEDTNIGSISKDIKTESEKKGQLVLLTNNSEVSKSDQINVCSKAGVPTLKDITVTAIDKYMAKFGSSCNPALHTINTEPKEQDKAEVICIPTAKGTKTSKPCDLGTKANFAMEKQDISTTETNTNLSTLEAVMETDIISISSMNRGTKADVTCDLTLDKGTKTDDTSDLTLDRCTRTDVLPDMGTETDDTFNLTMDRDTKTDAASNFTLETDVKTDVTSNLDIPTIQGDIEPEEISDSQLYAITAMDWTEETLGPAGDTKEIQQSKSKVIPPSIPDGTSVVKGLIRELSQLNMMLLRAKREMQTANQRMSQTRTSSNRVNTRTDK